MEQYLQAGKIVNTHGVRGAMMIEAWCDAPEVLAALKTIYLKEAGGFRPLHVTHAGVHKHMVLTAVEGIDDLDAALKLKNKIIYADRDDIPRKEGDYFIADLLGLAVIDARNGRRYGVLADVIQGGAGDIYEIDCGTGEEKKRVLMPAVHEFVDHIALGEAIYITPIPGFFEDENRPE